MFGLLGKHPILCGTALMLVHAAVTFLLWVVWYQTGAFKIDTFFFVWFPMSFAVPLVVNLLVTLARRRGGGSTTRLWALLAIGPSCCALSVVAIVAYRILVVQGSSASHVLDALGQMPENERVQGALALSVVGALVGLLAGLGIARWLIRSGRWETIVPVGKVR